MKTKAYAVRVKCNNCGYSGLVTIKQGFEVKQYHCPICQCFSLSKQMYAEGYVVEVINESAS